MIKDVSKLVCSKCGANKPIFNIRYTCRVIPLRKEGNRYDLEVQNEDMAKFIDDCIMNGLVVCKCAKCGNKINYRD